MNERKGSMSQQTFAILVANFLGLVIVLSSPARPPEKFGLRTGQKQEIAPRP